ncbi:hypothetical protein GQX73_g10291 [Xylaria multiplex]|uniref:Uncharacterized protein n=1 Tax=Xylaria multiplex TaxID=323545 RepID=A0A7C8IGR9_9PEZI|nr:hypothetical protein GQX73_g10291 [Xylaria multiplex]
MDLNTGNYAWAEPMDLNNLEHPSLPAGNTPPPLPLGRQEAGVAGEVEDASYPAVFEPGVYQGTPALSEMDPSRLKFVNEPYDKTITYHGKTLNVVCIGVQPQPPSKTILIAPTMEAHLLSAYTGLPLSWDSGPLHVSVEAPYNMANPGEANPGKANPEEKRRRSWWGYHSEVNTVLVEDCLNWAKRHFIPVVLPLIAALLRTEPVVQQEQWQWLCNALTNASFLQYITGGTKSHGRRLALWAGRDGPSLWHMMEAMRTLELPESALGDVNYKEQLRQSNKGELLALSRPRRDHWGTTKKKHIIEPELREFALDHLQSVALAYSITQEEFLSLYTLPDPSGQPVFCPFSPVCRFLLREMGYRWEDLFIFAQGMLNMMRSRCNKYAEQYGLGEPCLGPVALFIVMMHDLGEKHTKANFTTRAPAADAIIIDSFGLPYVPFIGHPLRMALCKKGDHGVAMMSGLDRYPGQEGFDPVRDFDRASCTFAFESAFTNNVCRNYNARDLPDIRTRASLVPLEHPLWAIQDSCGQHVWGFEGKGASATRPHAPLSKIRLERGA